MTDPTPTLDEQLQQLHDADTTAPDQMSAPPVESAVDSTPPAPLTDEDWRTIGSALRSWHRSPDSVLHRRAVEVLARIERGAR